MAASFCTPETACIAKLRLSPNLPPRCDISVVTRGNFCFNSGILAAPMRNRPMYRCLFIQAGRIAQGCNLRVETLDAAIATGWKILADLLDPDDCDGFE